MAIGYPHPLYILAFDHRGSMLERFGWSAETIDRQKAATIATAKNLIYDGVLGAVASGDVVKSSAGVLVDEQFASSIPARAHADGLTLAVCAEASGRAVFDYAHPDWQPRLERIRPAMVKVLVRYNPADPDEERLLQRDRLRTLSLFLQAREIKLLVELVVAPTPEHLALVNGDRRAYADTVRPGLVARAIGEFQSSGVEADLWKVEGMRAAEGYAEIAEAARVGGRADVACLVLGAGAPKDEVIAWLTAATTSPAFVGFAVGRSIWWDEIGQWHEGLMPAADAVESIASKYRAMVEVFRAPVVG